MAKSGIGAADMRFLYLSPASRQALLGMRALAAKGAKRFQLVAEVALRSGQPANMLAKIFQRLAKHRLLVSQRGPGGGYCLARPAAKISLAEILRAVQDIVPGGRHCLLGNRLCDQGPLCPIHNVIIRADLDVIKGFEAISLESLAKSGGWT